MLRMGLVGLGSMGRGHLTTIERLIEDGADIKLVALCDTDPKAFGSVEATLNLKGMEKADYDFSKYNCYLSVDEMLEKEELDLVNVVVPTYEHSTVACKVLNKGINCLCEKPMGISLSQCQLMIDTAKKNNVRLMIGQCERFEGCYLALKEIIDNGTLGAPVGGHYYRGGAAPSKDWFFCREKGGGGLFDQHVHDIDMVQYLYGMPKAVSTVGRVVRPGSGYDTCSTNYIYENGLCVHTSNNWVQFEKGFGRGFRADFEKGTVILDDKGLRAYNEKNEPIAIEKKHDMRPHSAEIKFFAELVANGGENAINPPEASMDTIRLALAEMESADKNGQLVEL